jgi:hypothetical protein
VTRKLTLSERRQVAAAAAGSVKVEGLPPSPAAIRLVDLMVQGKATYEETIAAILTAHGISQVTQP